MDRIHRLELLELELSAAIQELISLGLYPDKDTTLVAQFGDILKEIRI